MDSKKPLSFKEFPLSPISARKIVQDLANNHTGRIRFTRHARERMVQRSVSNRQILTVMRSRSSIFTEDPHPTPQGSWKCTMRGFAAGIHIEVAIDIRRHDQDPTAYVVTVFAN